MRLVIVIVLFALSLSNCLATETKTICDCRTKATNCLSEVKQSKFGLLKDFLLDVFETVEKQESTILTTLVQNESELLCKKKKNSDLNRLKCDGEKTIKILEAKISNDKDSFEAKCDTVKSLHRSTVNCNFNSTELRDLLVKKCQKKSECVVSFDDEDLNDICECSLQRFLTIEYSCDEKKASRQKRDAKKNRMITYVKLLQAGMYPFRVPTPIINEPFDFRENLMVNQDYYQPAPVHVAPFNAGYEYY